MPEISPAETALTGEPLLRLELVRQHGTFTQAYSTAVQPGLEHFWHKDC